MNRKKQDMTQGRICPLLLAFTLPIMLGNLLHDLYGLVDMTIAGYTLGDSALAAISATAAITTMVNPFIIGFNVGMSVTLGNAFGSGDPARMRRCFASMAELTAVMSVVLTVPLLIFIEPLLRLVRTPEALMEQSLSYITIILLGTPASLVYNLYAHSYKALGNSGRPLLFLVVSSVLNMGLDWLCMVPLQLGVRGAALATVISQILSAIMAGIAFRADYPELRIRLQDLKGTGSTIAELLPFGLSGALTNSVYAVGAIAVQGAVNALGTETIVANAAFTKIRIFACLFSGAVGNSIAAFAAQNYGARRLDRISKSIWLAVLMSLGVNIPIFLLVYFFGGSFAALITNTSSQTVITQAAEMSLITVPFIFCQTAVMCFRFTIQGMRRMILPILSTGMELVTRCVCAFIITPVIGYRAIALAEPSSWIVSTLFTATAYFIIARKDQRRFSKNT